MSQSQPNRGTNERENRVFQPKLREDDPLGSSESEAGGDFLGTAHDPSQSELSKIGAGNEQDVSDR